MAAVAAAAAVALVVAAVRRRRQRLTVLCQAGKPTPVHNPTCRSPQEDKGDTVDENDPRMTKMYDGRQESPPPNLESCGFELASCPTECTDFRNDNLVTTVYYDEMRKVRCSHTYVESLFRCQLHQHQTPTPTLAYQGTVRCGSRFHL